MNRKAVITGKLPMIIVSETDHDHLRSLAVSAAQSAPDAASLLSSEMRRAVVVPAHKVPPLVVRMGSTVEFSFDGGQPCEVTLVYPAKANIARGRISVLTPIGAALIGVCEGETITWKAMDGRLHKLAILRVAPSAPALEDGRGSQATVINFVPRSRKVNHPYATDPDGDPGPGAA